MNKPNVLLFDIDNTLLDFSAGAMQAMEEIFRAAGQNQGWLGYNRLFESNLRRTTEV